MSKMKKEEKDYKIRFIEVLITVVSILVVLSQIVAGGKPNITITYFTILFTTMFLVSSIIYFILVSNDFYINDKLKHLFSLSIIITSTSFSIILSVFIGMLSLSIPIGYVVFALYYIILDGALTVALTDKKTLEEWWKNISKWVKKHGKIKYVRVY